MGNILNCYIKELKNLRDAAIVPAVPAVKSSQKLTSTSVTSLDETSRVQLKENTENRVSGSLQTTHATSDAVTSNISTARPSGDVSIEKSFREKMQDLINDKSLYGGLLGLRGAAPKLPSFRVRT